LTLPPPERLPLDDGLTALEAEMLAALEKGMAIDQDIHGWARMAQAAMDKAYALRRAARNKS
jgi:hypothetical protein